MTKVNPFVDTRGSPDICHSALKIMVIYIKVLVLLLLLCYLWCESEVMEIGCDILCCQTLVDILW